MLIRSLIRSRCPAICLLRTACFVRALRRAHSQTHSLAPRLMGMRFMYMNIMHRSFIVSIQSALTRLLTPLTQSLAPLHHSLPHLFIMTLTRSRDRGKMWDNVPISACYPDAMSTQGYAKLGLGLLSLSLLVCSPTRSFARSLTRSPPYRWKLIAC